MASRLLALLSLVSAVSALSTGGCAKALRQCGSVSIGDTVYFEVLSEMTLDVVDVRTSQIVKCPSWIFTRLDQSQCPAFEYPYLVSLVAYAVIIALAVLLVAAWMSSTCSDDSVCAFRIGLATYWFGDLGAAIFSSFMVQTYRFTIGEENAIYIFTSLVSTNVFSMFAYDVPMMIVQHSRCIRSRAVVFVSCAALLGVLWSTLSIHLACNPSLGVLFGFHPIAVAFGSFLLDLLKHLSLRPLLRCLGRKPTRDLDPELGWCLLGIAVAVPQDDLRTTQRRWSFWKVFNKVTGRSPAQTLSRMDTVKSLHLATGGEDLTNIQEELPSEELESSEASKPKRGESSDTMSM